MDAHMLNTIANFIWGIADDCLRDVYVRGKYRDVILPMTVIRRLDAVLEDTKPQVLSMKKKLDEAGITNQWGALCNTAGQAFCNASPFCLRDLTSRPTPQKLKTDFEAYLDGFSPNVQEILDKFKFRNQIDTMIEADILGAVIQKFISKDINLSPKPCGNLPGLDNHAMGTIFEELVRRFNEAKNEEAGEHWTPRDVVELMADLVFAPIADQIKDATYSCYDGACGTGGMLTVAQDRLNRIAAENGKKVSIHLFGQEIQPETYAIAKADMMLKGDGEEAMHIAYGSTLSSDQHAARSFDFMLANPPYQLETGGGTDERKSATQARPIYHRFIEQGKKLDPKYICMIIPSRWYSGGMGLSNFRNDMLTEGHISHLVDYINSKDCFQGVDIAGGVCYFLWDRDHHSPMCEITNISADNKNTVTRPVNEFGSFFIRSNNAIGIIKKVMSRSERFMSDIVSPIDTFGIPSKEKGHPTYHEGDVMLLHTSGYNNQGVSYLSRDKVKKNQDLIGKYKVKISIMVPQGGEVGIRPENGYRSISTPQILPPNQVDSFSYLNIGFFDTEEEAKNLVSFISTKFARFLLRTTYSSVHVSKDNFCFVPLVDYHQAWSDDKLYDMFGLDDDEIALIEQTMRPMDTLGGDD